MSERETQRECERERERARGGGEPEGRIRCAHIVTVARVGVGNRGPRVRPEHDILLRFESFGQRKHRLRHRRNVPGTDFVREAHFGRFALATRAFWPVVRRVRVPVVYGCWTVVVLQSVRRRSSRRESFGQKATLHKEASVKVQNRSKGPCSAPDDDRRSLISSKVARQARTARPNEISPIRPPVRNTP